MHTLYASRCLEMLWNSVSGFWLWSKRPPVFICGYLIPQFIKQGFSYFASIFQAYYNSKKMHKIKGLFTALPWRPGVYSRLGVKSRKYGTTRLHQLTLVLYELAKDRSGCSRQCLPHITTLTLSWTLKRISESCVFCFALHAWWNTAIQA